MTNTISKLTLACLQLETKFHIFFLKNTKRLTVSGSSLAHKGVIICPISENTVHFQLMLLVLLNISPLIDVVVQVCYHPIAVSTIQMEHCPNVFVILLNNKILDRQNNYSLGLFSLQREMIFEVFGSVYMSPVYCWANLILLYCYCSCCAVK